MKAAGDSSQVVWYTCCMFAFLVGLFLAYLGHLNWIFFAIARNIVIFQQQITVLVGTCRRNTQKLAASEVSSQEQLVSSM